jgi:NTE family protein
MVTALIYTGAGARGILQASFAFAVRDAGIKPDMVFGGSAGALNAAMYQQDDWDLIEKTWLEIRNRDVYESNPLTWVGALTGKASVYSPKPLKRLINKLVDYGKQVNNPRPFTALATNIINRRPVALRVNDAGKKEDIVDFLFASASPPVFFPPVKMLGTYLSDCGISNNFAISNAVAAGADRLIILRPQPKQLEGPPNNIVQQIGLTISIATEGYLDRELQYVSHLNNVNDERYRDIEVVLVTCPSYGIDLLNFDYPGLDRKELMRNAYNLAKEALKVIS